MKNIRLALLFICCISQAQAQTKEISIDGTQWKPAIIKPLPMKGTDPTHRTLSVNNRYFELNGKPWFPVMGEFHFSRYPEKYWEEQVLKMKQGGISIIATYMLWNTFENPRGIWNWSGNNDLRRFITLCAKHDLFVWLRIGPYCNAEQLYGGFPEWIYRMKGKRSNDPAFLAAADSLYKQVGQLTKGLYFKDGGPIIGTQVENEYANGDPDHISMLKKMAIRAGIQPVFFSVTANTVFHSDRFEVLPLQGAYPYRGWEKAGGGPSLDFLYGNDQWIMTDALGKLFYDMDEYPKGMCEQGCGSQVTYANRFVVDPKVVEAHTQNQIGRGMNLIGYYMYQGGTQTPGLKDPSCPESYDFQAPLGEYGLPRASFHTLNILHHFINDFGKDLAVMDVLPSAYPVVNPRNTDSIRYSTRIKGNSGFVFFCNTQVRVPMPDKEVQLTIHLQQEDITFPAFTLAGETAPILPFNMDAFGITLKYATAQPLAKAGNTIFFTQVKGMEPEICLDAANIRSLEGWKKTKSGNHWILHPQEGNTLYITDLKGKRSSIVLLTREEAENSWRLKIGGKESLMISSAKLMLSGKELELRQLNEPDMHFKWYADGVFKERYVKAPQASMAIPVKDNAVQLPSSLPAGVSDVFLDIDYFGGSITGTINGKVVADDLYTGNKWRPGLKRFLGSKEMLLEVQPWDNKITGVQLPEDKKEGIRNIRVIPEYSVKVEL
ncbi:beta-galactosidase [Chitinophaga niabensis]|uniref:Beta-galactosidase n=1 Tax=Chitinophaga niabensis TaxID=536979 RepID=A0A1N6FHP8_9BACT|nr:beta-galactosidase [Chitinophaga niabensis]SIN94774.1 Glycosyl hydrolases family 35 [Chitinophaga niabensis]